METKLGGHCYLSLVTVAHWPVSLAPSHSMLFASCVTAHNISAWCSPARTVVFPCFQPNLLFSWLPVGANMLMQALHPTVAPSRAVTRGATQPSLTITVGDSSNTNTGR